MTDYFALAVQQARQQFTPPMHRDVPPPASGPKDCCADFARVVACDDVTDSWECPFCWYAWTAPCR